MPRPKLCFGEFELDPERYQLRRSGRVIKLENKPLDLLIFLVERGGTLVSREEIAQRLWTDGVFVDTKHGINTAVKKIRTALRDDPDRPRYIETIPGRGYRFMAEVIVPRLAERAIDVGTTGNDAMDGALHPPTPVSEEEALDASPGNTRFKRRRILWYSSLLLAAGTAAMAAWFVLLPQTRSRAPAAPIRSLAVLPLVNLSRDPDKEYLADGITEELIADLVQAGSVQVISRTSVMQYKNARKALPAIARELNVDAIIEGSLLSAEGRVRITVQLVDARTDRHVWARTYERSESGVLELQAEAARDISREVASRLAEGATIGGPRNRPSSPQAYDDYLHGRYFWNKRTEEGHRRAIEYFQSAISHDPGYALAYAGLADCYLLLGESLALPPEDAFPKARAAAAKALELDPARAEPHATLGALESDLWNWETAETEFRRALELSPNYATAHQWYAEYLAVVGRMEDALQEIRRAQKLDPLSSITNTQVGWILGLARRPDEAARQLRATVDMDPGFRMAYTNLGLVYEQMGRFDEAIAAFEKSFKLGGGADSMTWLAQAYASAGQKQKAFDILASLKNEGQIEKAPAQVVAMAWLAVGDKDQAFRMLNKGCRQHSLGPIKASPLYDVIRADPRYADLLRCMGF